MHILVTNDDGPPSNQSSPYVHSLVTTLQQAGHTVSVVLPHTQRSWIGKAHMVGQVLTPTYFRPGTLHMDDGVTQEEPFSDGGEEWVLLDGTPASCAQVGYHHLFNDRGPVDLILSGPNYGRNTTAVFALSSGTIGAALEGCAMGVKSIALSYAFNSREHVPEIIAEASTLSVQLIDKLTKEWPEDVHLFTINVPVEKGVSKSKIVYTHMIQNKWLSGSTFAVMPATADDKDPGVEETKIREGKVENDGKNGQVTKREHVKFKWAPQFSDVRQFSADAGSGDGWEVLQGNVTVTPLLANFWHANTKKYAGEIKLDNDTLDITRRPARDMPLASVQYPEPYVQPLIVQALKRSPDITFEVLEGPLSETVSQNRRVVQFSAYESLEFDRATQSNDFLLCAYVIRKALIRKHYLSNTISTWLVKHPQSMLVSHFKPCVHFELDYAEFLDDALVDAWDLNESMTRNETNENKEWWILKPGMSDGGNGIRLFSSLEQLQAIFEEWDPESDVEDEDETEGSMEGDKGAMTSQLRHFIAQPYIDRPLLLPAYQNRKFHIRTYVVVVGAMKVYVYRDMLALFAAKSYANPVGDENEASIDLTQHLTNTCFQDEATKQSSVHRFWDLEGPPAKQSWQDDIFRQICALTGEVLEAAAREQMVHFQAIPNAFEIFGVDFLVDADLTTWLLELNAYPDFKQTGDDLQSLVGGLFEDVVRVGVAPFFGSRQYEQGTDRMILVKEIDLGRR